MRDTLNLRSSLVPHIYTLARRTHQTSVGAINTPLYYDYPQYEQSYSYHGEFSWGDSVLVAPVTSPVNEKTGLAVANFFLPKGFRWVNWFTGKTFDTIQNFQEVSGKFTLPEIPALAKTGAIVAYWPLKQKELLGSAFNAPTAIGFQIFVDGYSSVQSSFELYEDSGNNVDYAEKFATTSVQYKQSTTQLSVNVAAPSGSYEGQPKSRNFEFKFLNSWAPSSVTINGQKIDYTPDNENGKVTGWRYVGDELALVINVANVALGNSVQVVVDLPQPLSGDLFSGVRGFIKRAKDGKMTLDYQWGQGTIFQEDYTRLVELSEIGSVLSSDPQNAPTILAGVQKLVVDAHDQLLAINYGNPAVAAAVAHQIDPKSM